MRLLDPTWIRDTVDYSFGDESGMSIDGYMRPANSSNSDFIQLYYKFVQEQRPYMTLFIDNMRLYRRDCWRFTAVEQHNDMWKGFRRDKLQQLANEDLLRLCTSLPDMHFIIFTGFEDMAIEEGIWDALPDNVDVYGCNCMVSGSRVHPIPFGLQRKTSSNDDRQQVIQELMDVHIEPQKLMYINFNIGNHPTRPLLANHYVIHNWVTINNPGMGLVYHQAATAYYTAIKQHKFMLCPSGNAEGCECHRDWETLYMRRVPILEDTSYHRTIFKDIPVLYINSLFDVTEQLLLENDYLYQQMQTFDLNKLDIEVLYNKCIQQSLTHKQLTV